MSVTIMDPEIDIQQILLREDYDPIESEAGEQKRIWMEDYLLRLKDSVLESHRRDGVALVVHSG
jgi:hypothetical protein